MKKIFLIIFFFFISQNAKALTAVPTTQGANVDLFSDDTERDSGFFAGAAFGYSFVTLTPSSSSKSKFQGWNGSAQGGFRFSATDSFGLVTSAEYKITDVTNTVQSSTYMEKANFSQFNGKLGFYYNSLTLGGGLSKTNVSIKDVSSSAVGETQNFNGFPKLGFANYSFEKNNLRGAIELEYIWGMINHDINYQDFSVGIHFDILF